MFLGSWLPLMVDGWDDSIPRQEFIVHSMFFKKLINHY